MNNFTQNFFTSSKNSFKKIVALCSFLLISCLSFGQSTIASEGFNNTSTLFAVSGGAYYTGNSASGDRPASSPLAVEGTHSYGLNATSSSTATSTMTTSDINTIAYTGISATFRLAAFSIGSTGNGMDGTDIVSVSISPDGGTNYFSTVRVLGNGNAYWSYGTGTGIASTAYDGNATSVDFSPAAGGNRTTDGYSTVTITNLPAVTNLRIRIILTNNATAERWLVDDFKVSGTLANVAPTVTTTTVSNVTTSTADSGGNITSDGGATLTASGVAFGTAANPLSGTSDGTATGTFTSNLTGLLPNTNYFYRAFASNSVGTAYGTELSFYTLANTPGTLIVGNAQVTTLDITVNSTTQNSNPVATEFAIHETTTNQFVQADGTLGGTPVWQTATVWSTISVTGLTQNTTYTFEAKARNNDSVETVYGETASGTTLANQTTDWCNLQSPASQTIEEGSTFNVLAQAYKLGLTEAAGQATGLSAWIGYSSTNSNPNTGSWTWISANFNTQVGNNDEFIAALGSGLTSGTYYYASRFQIGSGTYTYGGTGGIWNNDNAVLTVNPNLVDYCNVSPSGINNSNEGTVFSLYSEVYEAGSTPGAGAGSGITAWIGYNSSNNNPNGAGWTWVSATYTSETGNNDVYKIDLPSNLPIGTYYFASRYQKEGSLGFRYGGTNGLWNNDNGVLNVVSNLVDFCNIQFPLTGNITQGDVFTVYAQVYEPGITPGAGQGAGITAQIGYSTTNSTPDNTWTWLTASYHSTVTDNNDEYLVDLASGLLPGTYYYASRFQKSGSTEYQYGGTNGVWNNDNATLIVNQAVPVVTPASATGTVGAAFNYNISATNSPTTYAIVLGTLPAGLTLNETTGLISGTPTTVGVTSVDVTATNSGGTSTASTLSFTISQGSQTITFGALTPKTIGDLPFTLSATASSGLGVTYESSNTSVATVSGNTVTIVGVGTTTITASQAGDSNYLAATDVDQVLTVNAEIIVAWQFGNPASTGSETTYNATTNDANLNTVVLSRGAGITATGLGRAFSSNAWAIGGTKSSAKTDNEYYQFVVNVKPGYKLNITGLDATLRRTSTGPNAYIWTYSTDGTNFTEIGTDVSFTNSADGVLQAPIDLSAIPALQNVENSTNLTFRLYAWGSSSLTSTFAIGRYGVDITTNSLSLSGTIDAATSTTWNGAAWTSGLPNTSLEAIIDATYNTNVGGIQGPFTAKKLTVTTNGNLTINAGTNITVQNEVINNGTLTVESNANLVQVNNVTNSGNIAVKRETNPLMRFDYVMWSSPVDGTQKLTEFSPLTSVSPTIRFYNYDSANNVYTSVLSPSTTEFVNATGYLIRLPFNHPTAPATWTGTFSGVPNNGPISLSSLTSGLYYATGNPYPSTIDADEFITTNGLTDALYFWRKTNGAAGSAYATYTLAGGTSPTPGTLASPSSAVPNGTIQVGQGFITKATSSGSFVFDNTMRDTPNNDNQTFRSASSGLPSTIERNRFWLNLSNATQSIGQTMISYMTGATNGLDAQIDGKYIGDSATALTSLIEGQEFAIQGKTLPFAASDVVPLGFKTETAGNYSISIFDKDGLFANNGQIIYLRDNLLNTVQNLNSGAYSFTSQAGVFNGRFDVIYQNALSTDVVDFTSNNVSIYNQNNVLHINSGNNTMSAVKVYDVLGRLLAQNNQVNASQTQINIPATNQALIVQITSSEGIVVVKKVAN